MTKKRRGGKSHKPKNSGINLYEWWNKSSKKTTSMSGIDEPRKKIYKMYKKEFGGI
jgi:hypothetical protein